MGVWFKNEESIRSSLPEQNQKITLQAVISAILNLSVKNLLSNEEFLNKFSKYENHISKSFSIYDQDLQAEPNRNNYF